MPAETKPKSVFCWSGGKDSAYCLNKVLMEGSYEILYLLTTLSGEFRRISMHGVREELLEQQAAAIGIPLLKVFVWENDNAGYEKQMEQAMNRVKAEGVETVIFGDIFLEDLRAYRENNLARVGMKAVFPLWKSDTAWLIRDFLAQGFQSVVCCTNDGFLGQEWVGRELSNAFVDGLPPTVDPCGENGEYHTFCHSGPVFTQSIGFKQGDTIYKELEIRTTDPESLTRGFWYVDLLPADR